MRRLELVAEQAPQTVPKPIDTPIQQPVAEGQMDTAALIIGIDQLHKIRAILQQLSIAINA
jgi:hypothetical protein